MVNRERILETLISLIKIDSPSENEDAIARELVARFEALGADVHTDKPGNVIARFEGEGEPIILSAHMDTVEPGRNIEPALDGDVVTSRGETVLGADPKAGLATILEALTSLTEDGKKHLPIEVVVTREEETGSNGAKGLSYSDLKSTRAVVFDGDEQVYRVNTAAPGYYKFDATIIGRAAHAGVEPERGISAILIAAELISRLPAGRIDEETTANIGVINGGTARNAVPEKVEIKGETRSRNGKKLEEQAQIFRDACSALSEKYPEAKIEYELSKQFDSFTIPNDDPFVKDIDKALSAVKLKGSFEPTGGGSDANFFNAKGIKAVVVGTGVRDMHTTKESLNIPEMVEAACFCEKLLEV
jgi:tripeptide aminopeptidase